jgi:hypothetical protein
MSPRKKKSLPQKTSPFLRDYILLSKNVLFSHDKRQVTFVNVLDVLEANALPYLVPDLWLTVAFLRLPIAAKDVIEQEIIHTITLRGPSGKEIEVDKFPVQMEETANPFIYRIIVDLSRGITLETEGMYFFSVYEQSKFDALRHVITRPIPLILRPLEVVH